MINKKDLGKKIRFLREGLGLSQEKFAEKLNISRVAVAQIESGKRSINAIELAKIADVFRVSIDFLVRDEKLTIEKSNYNKTANKKIKFNEKKLKNTLLYILEKCAGKPNVGETVLYKLLYFIDFNSYEILGKPITGMNYVKLQYGPVPALKEYDGAIKNMLKEGSLKIFIHTYFNKPQKRYLNLEKSDTSDFQGGEIRIIDDVINKLSDSTAKQIEDYVHGDAPWQIVGEKEIIDYNLVFERQPPYAYRDYDQMWQDAAGRDALKELGPISKEEYDYYMNLE